MIGAGVAGLSAGIELGRAGLRVCLLEARDRIGGRIFTRHDPVSNAPIELGAEFIHGRPPELFGLLRPAGIEAEEMTGEDWCFRDGELCECDFFSRVDALLQKLDRNAPDKSFSSFLQHCYSDCADEQTKQWAVGYISGFHAADPNCISVHSLVKGMRAEEEIDGQRAFRIPRGYESLIEILRGQLADTPTTMRLETVVEAVNWRAGAVRIRARSSERPIEFDAPRALLTVPLGVLQTQGGGTWALRFTPGLPTNKQNALNHLAMGKVMRLTLRFRERFWAGLHSPNGESLSQLRFLFSQERCFPTWWTGPDHLPIITGWSPASTVDQFAGRSEGYVLGSAVHALSSLLKVSERELERLLESASWHDWQADPFSRGAYSYVKVGGETAQADLAAPLENTLFFAGEATDVSGHTGTVHGAMASGRRAASEILRRVDR